MKSQRLGKMVLFSLLSLLLVASLHPFSSVSAAGGWWRPVDEASVYRSYPYGYGYDRTNYTIKFWIGAGGEEIVAGFKCDDLDIDITGTGARVEIWVRYYQEYYGNYWIYRGGLLVERIYEDHNGYYARSGTAAMELDEYYNYKMQVEVRAYAASGSTAFIEFRRYDHAEAGACYA